MEIREIVHLLHVLWNHEPMPISSSGKQKRDSRLPVDINVMFWLVCDREEEHAFFDKWETQEQDIWGKQAWR